MVAVIEFPQLRKAFHYNENKLKTGAAMLHEAHLYHKDTDQLSVRERFQRLDRLTKLRPDVQINCVHISLNFDPSEQLSKETLLEIAEEYMEKIGFGAQPWLVYEHFDAAHQHLHILTTCIKLDGGRIALHNIGRDKSEPAREELEKKYGLVAARGRGKKELYPLKPADLTRALYGKTETKAAIANIVRSVVKHYKFTSLAEYNTILRQFNVVADRGEEGTLTFEKKGLLYSLVDAGGKKVGVPIKASSIFGKPTLPALEEKFVRDAPALKLKKGRIARVIDDTLRDGMTREYFITTMHKHGIHVVFRENEAGRIYGITYVDNIGCCVLNGSAIGKRYSAKEIVARLSDGTVTPARVLNEKFARQQWRVTEFNQGFVTVMAGWAKKGLVVRAHHNDAGNTYYTMGHYLSPAEDHWPANRRMTSWLKANGFSKKRSDALHEKLDRIFASAGAGELAGNLPGTFIEAATGMLAGQINNLFETVFSVVEQEDAISYELVKEARKKRKRRRPS